MSTRSVAFFNSRTLGFLMACDDGDKEDETIWDGDILPPYQFDDFDDDPHAELKDLLKKFPSAKSPPLLRCSGEATSYIKLQPVTSIKPEEVSNKNSDIVKDLPQNFETLRSEVNKVSVSEEPPDINNMVDVYDSASLGTGVSKTSSDTLADIVQDLGISDSDELVLDTVREHEITKNTDDMERNLAMPAAQFEKTSQEPEQELSPGHLMINTSGDRMDRSTETPDTLVAVPIAPAMVILNNSRAKVMLTRELQHKQEQPPDTVRDQGHEIPRSSAPQEQTGPVITRNEPLMAAEVSVITEGPQCQIMCPEEETLPLSPERILISDKSEEGEQEEATPTLLDYRSICENIIQVHASDMLTLRPGEYVSDPIINMYLDYLHRKVSPALQQDIFIFPTWCYQLLSHYKSRMKPPVNIFDKGCKYDKISHRSCFGLWAYQIMFSLEYALSYILHLLRTLLSFLSVKVDTGE